MDLLELKSNIYNNFDGTPQELEKIIKIVEEDQSIFPFNEYEYLLHNLVNTSGYSFEKYKDIRDEYISRNPNLWIFEISAPRDFGEKFAQTYINGMCQSLQKPSKKLDPTYNGEYDFWLNGIKIEVKASRAVDKESNEPLYIKALSSTSNKKFLMNFQQLKPGCCDVFIWVAVFRDKIKTWVLSSDDVLNHPLYSKGQHRGNHGNEGQLQIKEKNIHLFDSFELGDRSLKDVIEDVSERKSR